MDGVDFMDVMDYGTRTEFRFFVHPVHKVHQFTPFLNPAICFLRSRLDSPYMCT